MPIPALALGAIGAGVGALGNLASGLIQNNQINKTNAQNRQFALDMYNMQRRDTLADWARTNEYNDPAQQMARFKAAGLSPHLIYGQMNNAPAIKTPDAPKFEAMPHQRLPIGESVQQGLSAYFDSQMKQADLDLTKQNLVNQQAQKEFIEANTLKVLKDTDLKAFELYMKDRLLPTIEANMWEKGRQMRADITAKYGHNEREWQKLPKQIDLMLSQIAANKARTAATWQQKTLYEIQAAKLKMETYWGRLNNAQKYAMGNILQESQLYKNLLTKKQITTEDEKAFRLAMQNAGLSPEQSTNLLKTVISLFKN